MPTLGKLLPTALEVLPWPLAPGTCCWSAADMRVCSLHPCSAAAGASSPRPGTTDRQPAVMLRPGLGEDLVVLAGDTLRAGNEGPEMCHCP